MTKLDELFGANTLRLSPRQWAATMMLSALLLGLAPTLWFSVEKVDSSNDYRIPYAVSKDYGLYQQHLQAAGRYDDSVFVVGDSVVWGEYVRKDGTLSHFLSNQDDSRTYLNAGINGLFPLALEGLVNHYGKAMTGRNVILHCNLLWMSSPEADLSVEKERVFNHVELVPQFRVGIPCYKAEITERTANVVRHWVPHLRWARHLQVAHFDGLSIPEWTLVDDGKYPPSYPHTYRTAFSQIKLTAPQEPESDSERGIDSERHKPWSESGRGPQSFEWVPMDQSLQWAAFQRLVNILRARENQVLVVLGPFNEHMIAEQNRTQYAASKLIIETWLKQQTVLTIAPNTLPSDLYGDASHPLTDGYRRIAEELVSSPEFQQWLSATPTNR